jgi:hypothetical protein
MAAEAGAPARWEGRDLERRGFPFFSPFYAGGGSPLVLVDTRSSLIAKRDRDSASANAHAGSRSGATTRRRSRSLGVTRDRDRW